MNIVGVIVSYNSARDLPSSLASLRELGPDRIVVVDTGSIDASVTIARAVTPDVLRLSNVGFGAAVNTAAAAAPDADAYFLLNPDCRIARKDFDQLVTTLRDDPGVGAAAPVMRYPGGRYGISSGSDPSVAKEWLAALRVDHLVPRWLRGWLVRSPRARRRLRMLAYLDVEPSAETRAVDWVSGFCMLVRANAFRAVGGFDPDYFLYFEDADICRRLRERGWRVVSVGAAVAEHKESTSTAAVGKRPLYRDGMWVYFGKYGSPGQRLLARALRRMPI